MRQLKRMVMNPPVTSDTIRLRQRKTAAGSEHAGDETTVTLAEKLRELLKAGYAHDDIYGFVIPLLMQGKVRIDLEGRSERLEMEDAGQKLPRTEAVRVFEDHLATLPAKA